MADAWVDFLRSLADGSRVAADQKKAKDMEDAQTSYILAHPDQFDATAVANAKKNRPDLMPVYAQNKTYAPAEAKAPPPVDPTAELFRKIGLMTRKRIGGGGIRSDFVSGPLGSPDPNPSPLGGKTPVLGR